MASERSLSLLGAIATLAKSSAGGERRPFVWARFIGALDVDVYVRLLARQQQKSALITVKESQRLQIRCARRTSIGDPEKTLCFLVDLFSDALS